MDRRPALAATHKSAPRLIGGHVALDLVNTVAWRPDPDRRRDDLGDFEALAAWCSRAGLIDEVTTRELAAAAAVHPRAAARAFHVACALREYLHDALAPILEGNPVLPPPQMHDLLVDAIGHSHLIGMPMYWQLTPHGVADIPRLLALHALNLLQSPELPLLRLCDGPDCGWIFLDRTRSHSRRWCSSSDCGNNDRARRYYVRQRNAAGGFRKAPVA